MVNFKKDLFEKSLCLCECLIKFLEENDKNNNKFFANDFLFVNILIFSDSESCL